MTEITSERKNIQIEEVDYKSGVAERTFFKIGAAINFINKAQNSIFDFKFNGQFIKLFGGEDGGRGFIFDAELVGISGLVRVTGSSGNTILDLHLIRNDVDLGSILTTKLIINFNAPSPSGFYKNYLDLTEYADSNITLPVFSSRDIQQGDVLRADLDQNATGALDLSVNIHFRPR